MRKDVSKPLNYVLTAGRLPEHAPINTKAVARRENRIGNIIPDGIAYPKDNSEIHRIFKYSKRHHAQIVVSPCLERINQLQKTFRQTPVLLVKTNCLTSFFQLDPENRLATFSPGISGIDLEFKLRSQGFTLGHLIPFIDYSTLCELAVDYLKNLAHKKTDSASSQFLVNASIVTEEDEFEISSVYCPGLTQRIIHSLTHKNVNDPLLSSVTIRVFPLPSTGSENSDILNAARQKAEDKICLDISDNEQALMPVNALARNLLAELNPDEQHQLLAETIAAYRSSVLRFEWNEYEAELEIQQDKSYRVYLSYQKVGSSVWLQMKFDLTLRESNVCHLMMRGRSDKDIARILNISYWTVRTHVSNILRKLGINSRSEIGSTVLSEMTEPPARAVC